MWGTLTVLDAINEHDGEYIKVGFGQSYVYCDTANDEAKDAIDKAGRAWLLKTKKKLRRKRALRNDIMRNGLDRYIQTIVAREIKKENLTAYANRREPKKVDVNFIRKRAERYVLSLDKDINAYRRRIKAYHPFLDLEVTDCYKSFEADNCTIIVADHGMAVQGLFWDREEYRRFMQKGELPKDDSKDDFG